MKNPNACIHTRAGIDFTSVISSIPCFPTTAPSSFSLTTTDAWHWLSIPLILTHSVFVLSRCHGCFLFYSVTTYLDISVYWSVCSTEPFEGVFGWLLTTLPLPFGSSNLASFVHNTHKHAHNFLLLSLCQSCLQGRGRGEGGGGQLILVFNVFKACHRRSSVKGTVRRICWNAVVIRIIVLFVWENTQCIMWDTRTNVKLRQTLVLDKSLSSQVITNAFYRGTLYTEEEEIIRHKKFHYRIVYQCIQVIWSEVCP